MVAFNMGKQYRYFPFLIMLLLILSLCMHILSFMVFKKSNFLNTAIILGPFWLILWDILAEVYGYKRTIKIYWLYVLAKIIFYFMCFIIIWLSYSPLDKGSILFLHLFSDIWDNFLINPFAYFFAIWVNIKLLTKWKILLHGKYFWLRSMMSSMVREMLFFGILTIKISVLSNIVWSDFITLSVIISLRVLVLGILAYPGVLLVNILKIIEHSQYTYDNPFKTVKIENRSNW